MAWTKEQKEAAGERMRKRWAAIHAGEAPRPKMGRKAKAEEAAPVKTARGTSTRSVKNNGHRPGRTTSFEVTAKRAGSFIEKISRLDARRKALDVERLAFVRELNQLVGRIGAAA